MNLHYANSNKFFYEKIISFEINYCWVELWENLFLTVQIVTTDTLVTRSGDDKVVKYE